MQINNNWITSADCYETNDRERKPEGNSDGAFSKILISKCFDSKQNLYVYCT